MEEESDDICAPRLREGQNLHIWVQIVLLDMVEQSKHVYSLLAPLYDLKDMYKMLPKDFGLSRRSTLN